VSRGISCGSFDLEVIPVQKWVSYNANPDGDRVGDCVIRALSAALGKTWEETYVGVCVQGFLMRDMPSADRVWGAFLRSQGFRRHLIDADPADCYTVRDFCEDHPDGEYILAISGHVVFVRNGCYMDSWDSGSEVPVFYWERSDNA
jgi:hypothetical protein